MYFLKKGDSLEIAKNLIQKTGLEESLIIFERKNRSAVVPAEDLLKWVLALSACNLSQTIKVDFVEREIGVEDQQDIIDDYIVESLRRQHLVKLHDGAEMMEKWDQILGIVKELQVFWKRQDDPKDLRPRYLCVKEVLQKLGGDENYGLHDDLFEFMYLQHKHFIDFFRALLVNSKHK